MQNNLKWLAWEITRRCNLRCVHCRSSSECEVANHPDVTLDTAKQFIDSLDGFAKPTIVLTGGEPLLHPHVFDIAKYGKSKDFRICLATNGLLITAEICEQIKAADIKMVSLSLDGPNAEVHDDFRKQQGAFEATIEAEIGRASCRERV